MQTFTVHIIKKIPVAAWILLYTYIYIYIYIKGAINFLKIHG